MTFTDAELTYLAGQRLGRLATVAADGMPQVNPTSFRYDPETGTIEVGGQDLGATKKFRNVEATGRAAFVVDDIASYEPWTVRGIEIRGTAEALRDQPPPFPWASPEVIRIHPQVIFSWGIESGSHEMRRRTVAAARRP